LEPGGGLEINKIIVEDYREMSEKAAALVVEQIDRKKDTVLGLPTGSTPKGMYARLTEMYREDRVNFSEVVTFNLDEYVGLPPDHPQSYHHYMHRHFFEHVNVKSNNIHLPEAYKKETGEACREYEQKIREAGGIDLQLMGIGLNGHIGFNEPDLSLPVYTTLVDLAEETIEANSRFFESRREVPQQAITMGVGTIMRASKLLLLATGESKAEALQQCFGGRVSTEFPASLLQLHRDFTLLADKEAASLL